MTRILIYLIGLIVSILIACFVGVSNPWFSVWAGVAVGFLIPLIDAVVANVRWLKIIFYSLRAWRGRVRISISYLYRIRVENEYLLVKGKRFEQFQPVGGVYKFHASSLELRNKLDIRDDDLLVPDQISDQDLRVRIPGKNLLPFIKWFESGIGRETDAWREFYEELIVPNILPGDVFKAVRYDRIRRHYEPMRFSEHAQLPEILIADIFELLPTPEQLRALKGLRERGHPEIHWAREAQIQRRGAIDASPRQTTTIARTAAWTLSGRE